MAMSMAMSLAAAAATTMQSPKAALQMPTLGRSESSLRLNSSACFSKQISLKASSGFQVRAAAATAAPSKFKTMKPLGDRVLVKIATVDEKTSGGVLLPAAAQTKPQAGEVVAVGDGKTIANKKTEPIVKVGSTVVYSKYAGTEIQFNDAEHVLLKEDDIMGFLSTDDIKDLKPLGERVLIEVFKPEEKTVGGIILTEAAKEKPLTGKVVAVGRGSYGEDGNPKPMDLEPGNNVMYSKFAGNDFKSKDGTNYVVIRASDVLAVLPGEL